MTSAIIDSPVAAIQLDQPLRRIDHDPLRRRHPRAGKSPRRTAPALRLASARRPASAAPTGNRPARPRPTASPAVVTHLAPDQVVHVVRARRRAAGSASAGTRSSTPRSVSASLIVVDAVEPDHPAAVVLAALAAPSAARLRRRAATCSTAPDREPLVARSPSPAPPRPRPRLPCGRMIRPTVTIDVPARTVAPSRRPRLSRREIDATP